MSSSISLEYWDDILVDQVNVTKTALCAQNTAGSSISVVISGVSIALATRPYNNGFTVDGTNKEFTVTVSGTYFIDYGIYTTTSLLLSSSVYKNNAAISNLTRSPTLSGNTFSVAAIVPLTSGDVLELTLFGLLGTATLQGGVGAYMNVVRIV